MLYLLLSVKLSNIAMTVCLLKAFLRTKAREETISPRKKTQFQVMRLSTLHKGSARLIRHLYVPVVYDIFNDNNNNKGIMKYVASLADTFISIRFRFNSSGNWQAFRAWTRGKIFLLPFSYFGLTLKKVDTAITTPIQNIYYSGLRNIWPS